MALVRVPTLAYPSDDLLASFTNSTSPITSLVMNAATDKVAIRWMIEEAGSISDIEFSVSAFTQCTNGVKVTVQALDTNGVPDGSALATKDPVAISGTGWKIATLATPLAVSAGDILSTVIEFSSFAASDSISIGTIATGSGTGFKQGTHVLQNTGAAWAKRTSHAPQWAVKYSGGSYRHILGAYPYTSQSATTYNNASSPDEKCQVLTPVIPGRISGIWVSTLLANNATAKLSLYDMASVSDTASRSELGAVTIGDEDHWLAGGTGGSGSIGVYHGFFSTPIDVSPGVYYRVSLLPTSANNVTGNILTLNSATLRQGWQGGVSWEGTSTRTDTTGTWGVITQTERMVCGLIYSHLHDSAGVSAFFGVTG